MTNGPRTHAQRIAVDECCLFRIPDDLSFDDAAAVVSMGLAAIDVLERLSPPHPGRRILIVGAAGRLGIYSVQLAKSQGAEVTAVCSAKNADWMKKMGAEHRRPPKYFGRAFLMCGSFLTPGGTH